MEKTFYISKEQYITLLKSWKKVASHSASDIVIYNILRSKPADRGFSERKSNIQGHNSWYAFNEAVAHACYEVNLTSYPHKAESKIKAFFDKFGLEIPADLDEQLRSSKK